MDASADLSKERKNFTTKLPLTTLGTGPLARTGTNRLTGAASESASSARDKVFARLPWDPVLRDCLCAISGPGLCLGSRRI